MLRILAISAQLTFIPYCFFQPTPLWSAIAWNLLFLGVNIFNVVKLLLEKRQFDKVDNNLVWVREKGKGEREKAVFSPFNL